MTEVPWEEIEPRFDLWDNYVEHLKDDREITGLWPPQLNALEEGALDDENFLMVSPPGTGKTLISEIIAVHEWQQSLSPSVYLVPYVSLAEEKYSEFDENLGELGMGVAHAVQSEYPDPEEIFSNEIIVMTYEKFDYYLRNYPDYVDGVGCAVVDEFHTVSNEDRGPSLESVVTSLKTEQSDIRIVGLSATIPNTAEVSEWLGGSFSDNQDWRHNELHEGVCLREEEEVHFYHDGDQVRNESVNNHGIRDYKINSIIDFLVSQEPEEPKQALVYAPTRRDTRETAMALANYISEHERSQDFGLNQPALDRLKDRIEEGPDRGDTESELLYTIGKGIGFHHAGLSDHSKQVLEEGFDKGHLSTIVSTSTLAAGVNLPIKRIFVLDPKLGRTDMKVSQYKNLIGRAGRPRIDEPGESVLFARSEFTSDPVVQNYINAEPEPFESQIDLGDHYGILLNLARQYPTISDLLGFMQETYLGQSGEVTETDLGDSVGTAVTDLNSWDMLELDSDEMILSPLGEATSKQLINPQTVHLAIRYLQDSNGIDLYDFLATLASSPEFDMGLRIWRPAENQADDGNQIRQDLGLSHIDTNDFDKVLTTADIIHSWTDELDIDEIFEAHNIDTEYWGFADVYQRIVPTYVRTLKSVEEILEDARPDLYDEYGEELGTIQQRVNSGLEEDSLPFVKYNIEPDRQKIIDLRERIGIETPEDLLDTTVDELVTEMRGRRARDYRRRAIQSLRDGFQRDKELVLLDANEQGQNQSAFSTLLSVWEDEFESCVLDQLESLEHLRVERVDETGPGFDPEAYCNVYETEDRYLGNLEGGTPFEIAIECKSKRELNGCVKPSDATAVLQKARDRTNAHVTIGTPTFTEDAKDAARETGVCLMDAPAFVATMIRIQQNELSPQEIRQLFSQTGYLSRDDVYLLPDNV